MITCIQCGQQFKTKIKINGKLHDIHHRKTCINCQPIKSQSEPRKIIKCVQCGKSTKNPKFCCRSCSVTYTNLNKKHKEKYCKHCGIQVGYGWRSPSTCKKCNGNCIDWSQITLKEFGEKYKLNNYQRHARLRSLSRSIYKKSGGEYQCKICGYNLHIEICHIKDVKDFSEDSTVAEVNDLSNLVALCRNHHWEFDHGHLKL